MAMTNRSSRMGWGVAAQKLRGTPLRSPSRCLLIGGLVGGLCLGCDNLSHPHPHPLRRETEKGKKRSETRMVLNGFALPISYVKLCQEIRAGKAQDSWLLKGHVDAYGNRLSNSDLELLTDL